MNNRLWEILTEMQRLSTSDANPDDGTHGDADKLLCETILLLADLIDQEAAEIAPKIVEAYNAKTFPKWYA